MANQVNNTAGIPKLVIIPANQFNEVRVENHKTEKLKGQI